MKNGTTRQKVQPHALAEWMERHSHVQSLAMELVHDVAQGRFESVGEMLSTTGNMAADLLGGIDGTSGRCSRAAASGRG